MPNSSVKITSDGSITTYDRHGVRISELSGDLKILHRIVKLNQLRSNEKRKLVSELRLHGTIFNFVREDTGEVIEIPIQHIIRFMEYVDKGDVEDFVTNLLLQIPK